MCACVVVYAVMNLFTSSLVVFPASLFCIQNARIFLIFAKKISYIENKNNNDNREEIMSNTQITINQSIILPTYKRCKTKSVVHTHYCRPV